jgi:hypothetical protein
MDIILTPRHNKRVENWDLKEFCKKLDEELDCRVYYFDDHEPLSTEEMTDKYFFEENSLVFLKYFAQNKLSQSNPKTQLTIRIQ